MANFECAGCPNALDNTISLQCHRCNDKYHVACTRITMQDFNVMSSEMKSLWICDVCRCKQPRGDHSNTPVRNSPVEMEFVTQRVKSRSNCSCLSASNIREMIREELRNIFSNDLHPKIHEIKNTLASFETSLSSLNQDIDKVKSDHANQSEQMQHITKENETLRAANKSIITRLTQLEQQTRASNIEIQCVPENRQENLVNTVQQLGNIIKCPIAPENIHFCARIAKMNTKSPRPRSILVKFSSPRLRDDFLAATIKYNKTNNTDKLNTSHLGIASAKNTPIYVAENLTPEGKILHVAARRKAKELGFRFVWVRDGKIFVRKSEGSNYIHIRNHDTVNNLS
ncbi:unnamed protein product [Parnassius mnemosyne]|uniref:Zinc finger PHD-type domain-containing protein n=1 Tax=Parnassius mnemosyne TaxID=213953 RepID=A0AAV1M5E5_9NEOP